MLANIFVAYTVYFNNSIVRIFQLCGQGILLVMFICSFVRWIQVIAAKQNVKFIHFRKLTTDEYAAFSYIIPLFISMVIQFLYPFFSGEISWQSRSQTGLLVHMATIYFSNMSIIRKIHIKPSMLCSSGYDNPKYLLC